MAAAEMAEAVPIAPAEEPVPAARRAVAHLTLAGAPTSFYARIGKPVFDRVVAAILFLLLLPMTLLVALAVLVVIGPPVLFRQSRVGRAGRAFSVLKFRTMRPDRRRERRDVIEDRRMTHKSERDPRHTRLGRQLRKWSLDELPQLWNVLRGDMSLVGPRPELVEVVEPLRAVAVPASPRPARDHRAVAGVQARRRAHAPLHRRRPRVRRDDELPARPRHPGAHDRRRRRPPGGVSGAEFAQPKTLCQSFWSVPRTKRSIRFQDFDSAAGLPTTCPPWDS